MNTTFTRTLLLQALLLGLFLGVGSAFAQKFLLVGDAAAASGLPSAEQNAYNWALSHFGADAGYSSFSDISTNGLPANTRTIWYHFEDDPALPASGASAASTIEAFVDNGGGILCSGFATEYIVTINATAVGPNETINNDPAGPDAAWGIRPLAGFEGHPAFAGIPYNTDWVDPNWIGFRTISDSVAGREAIRWWTGNSFPGTTIGTMPWFGGTDLTSVGELAKGLGNTMVCTAPGFNWVNAPINGVNEQTNLEQFTANMLNYLATDPTVVLVGDAADVASLPLSEQNAYSWALSTLGFGATYQSFADVSANGLPASAEVVWYHLEDAPAIPASATSAATTIGTFVADGGGLFLSSFATEYAVTTGITSTGPNETIDNDPAGPDAAWGIRPFPGFETHPLFDGIPPATDWADPNWMGFRTISDSVAGHEAVRWWTGNSFPGTGYAAMPWFGGLDLPIVGEIPYSKGTMVFTSAPGYQWLPAATNGANEQDNLEKYTENVLNYLQPDPSVILVGGSASINDMPPGERNAYNWAVSAFGLAAGYVSFAEIASDGIPESAKVIWYHQEDSATLPAEAINIASDIETFVSNGGGILLSGFATGLAVDINATTVAPNETIDNDPAGPDAAWGVRPFPSFSNHPIFDGIPLNTDWIDPNWSGFRTVSDSVAGREAMRWWTGNTYPGTGFGAMPWFLGEDLPVVGEIPQGMGAVITCTAPGFNWVSADINGINEQNNLEQFTENMLNYLFTVSEVQELELTVQGAASNDINENEEDGKIIEVGVRNATFKPTLEDTSWVVANLPQGISYALARVDDQTATLTLSGTPTDYDVDITDFTVQVPSSEFVDLRTDTLSSVGDVIFRAFVETDINPGKIVLLGVPSDTSGLDSDELAAYRWVFETFGDDDVDYFSFLDVALDSVSFLSDYRVAWWHYDTFRDLPVDATNGNISRIMRKFHQAGNSIFLSTFATQYAPNLDLEPHTFAMEVHDTPTMNNSDPWGYHIAELNHPAFNNLTKPEFFTLQTNGNIREDNWAWWVLDANNPAYDSIPVANRFRGTVLASTEWDDNNNIVMTVGEYESDGTTGSVFVVGAGAYDWDVSPGTNPLHPNMETFTFNILNYLKGVSNTVSNDRRFGDLSVKAYPNPFRTYINLQYVLPKSGHVKLEIFDVNGRKIETIVDEVQGASMHEVIWQPQKQPSGVYIYRITAGDIAGHGKIYLVK